jgi:hypothetical protein
MAQHLQGMPQGAGQPRRAALIPLQQVIGHALGGFGPHPGQAAQGFDQGIKTGRTAHANDSRQQNRGQAPVCSIAELLNC